jgi:uncharacterized protein (UPF0212 family)
MQDSRGHKYTIIIGAFGMAQHGNNHAHAFVVQSHGVVKIILATYSAMMKSGDGEDCGHQQRTRRCHAGCDLAKVSLAIANVHLEDQSA